MKKIYLITLLFVFVFSSNVRGKEINFTFPTKALQDFVFVTYNGLKIDTLAVGKTNFAGSGTIRVKQGYDTIAYMGVLFFTNNQALDLIVAEKDFSFREEAGALKFTNSRQNDLLYNNKSAVASSENNGLFVQDYMNLMAAVLQLNQIARNEQQTTMAVSTKARVDGLMYINPNILYYTKFWSWGINGFLMLTPSQEAFAKDMITLLDKTTNSIVYQALVEDLITITNQYGMDDAFALIIKHVMDSGRIQYPQGVVFDAFQSMKVYKGSRVEPFANLEKLSFVPFSTLLVFNSVDCEHCAIEIKKLEELNSLLEEKRIRIITITSASDKEEFLKEVTPFPWKDKIMDNTDYNKSFFRSFGIIGTPTLFLIDSDNIVQGKYSTIDALLRDID